MVTLQITSRRWPYPLVLRNYSCLLHGLQTGISLFFSTHYIHGRKPLLLTKWFCSLILLVYVELPRVPVSTRVYQHFVEHMVIVCIECSLYVGVFRATFL